MGQEEDPLEMGPISRCPLPFKPKIWVGRAADDFAGVPLSGCVYKGVETLPQEPSDVS